MTALCFKIICLNQRDCSLQLLQSQEMYTKYGFSFACTFKGVNCLKCMHYQTCTLIGVKRLKFMHYHTCTFKGVNCLKCINWETRTVLLRFHIAYISSNLHL